MRLTLHVGLHKTGTTSIQHFLAHNQRELKEAGLIYPTSIFPNFKRQHSDMVRVAIEGGAAAVAAAVAPLKGCGDHVILSGENLSGTRHVGLIVDGLRTVFDEIRFVMVIRNKADWLYSQYMHHLRFADYIVTVDSFTNHMRANPRKMFQLWSEHSDSGELLIFEDHKKDIVKGFVKEILGLDVGTFKQLDKKSNVSLDYMSSTFLNALGESKKDLNRARIMLTYAKIFGDDRYRFSVEDVIRAEINSRYADENWIIEGRENIAPRICALEPANVMQVDREFTKKFMKFVAELSRMVTLKNGIAGSRREGAIDRVDPS